MFLLEEPVGAEGLPSVKIAFESDLFAQSSSRNEIIHVFIVSISRHQGALRRTLSSNNVKTV